MRYFHVVSLCILALLFSISGLSLFLSGPPPLENVNAVSLATTYTVDASGNGDFIHLQDAINASTPSDTIFIKKGSYPGGIIINKTLTLIGEDQDTTVIDGHLEKTVINITADAVNISHLTIKNSARGIDAGIKIEVASNVNISHCTFSNNYYGIWMYQSHHNTLYRCQINQNYYGIMLHYVSQDNTVIRCQVESNENTGIYLCCSSTRNLITQCDIISNWEYGIDVHVWDTMVYLNNFIENGVNARSINVNAWDNGEKGNYWSDFNEENEGAYDVNDDGIIDEDYSIPDNNKDRYPLMDRLTFKSKGNGTPGMEFPVLLLAGAIFFIIHKKYPGFHIKK